MYIYIFIFMYIISTNQVVNHQFVRHNWSCPNGRPICTTACLPSWNELILHEATTALLEGRRSVICPGRKGFKVDPGAGCLWSYSWAKFHVRFGGCDVGRNCFAICDESEICPIFSVIDSWSATCTTSFQSFGAPLLVPSFCSQSIHKSTSCHR